MSQSTSHIRSLLRSAGDQGMLSRGSVSILNTPDLGQQIQQGLGIKIEDVEASEVLLVSQMPDDSGSIRFSGNSQAVRDGHNMVLEALGASNKHEAILAHTRFLNGDVLFPYLPLDRAVRLDAKNFNPNQGTPLYDQTLVLLGSVMAKAQDFADAGVLARSISLIITDGADQHSTRAKARDVAKLVRDMTATENHIVAAMGIDDGSTDFRRVFSEMGIDPSWVLTPSSDAKSIRRAFQLFSQSVLRMSQGAQPSNFGGGFFC